MNASTFIARIWRFLTFRGLKIDSPKQLNIFLIAGILFAWIAGIGRYWDHPSAQLWQYLGLGSVIYIFVLALILWALIYPIRKGPWRYKSVLTFVALTSPLAWLYAVPVERFMALDTAITANIVFLAIVALWRVGLLVHFLKTYGRFTLGGVFVITILPLALIIAALSLLNLEQAVFEIMAGIGDERSDQQQIHDAVYANIFVMSIVSFLALPVFGLIYLAMVFQSYKTHKKLKEDP